MEKKAANEYCQGIRKNIDNDRPVIGPYGVNKEGSGDMYAKGANMLHTIRQVIGDDILFRKILRGLNTEFFHRTIDSKDVEMYMSRLAKKDLSKIFDQYLRTIKIPTLEYKPVKGNAQGIQYRWTNCVGGFDMPVDILIGEKPVKITPTTDWKTLKADTDFKIAELKVDPNYYIQVKKGK